MLVVIPGLALFVLPVLLVLLVLVVVAWRPSVSVVIALVLCQEIAEGEGFGLTTDTLQAFGHQLYFVELGNLPIFELLLVFAATAGLAHKSVRQGERGGRTALVLIALGGLLIGIAAGFHDLGPLSILGQSERPLILAGAAMVLSLTTRYQPGGWAAVTKAAGAAMLVIAAAGMFLLASGRVSLALDGSTPLFYDSALPAVAGAVFLTLLLRPAERRWRLLLLAATGFIVLLSGRRNVWVAMFVALVVLLVVRSGRAKNLVRLAVGGGLIVGLVVLITPGVLGVMGQRLQDSINTASGSADEVSTSLHLSDLSYGWKYALDAPFLGYGPYHPPLPGLAVQQGSMYVHNEFLIVWLRYGLPGLLTVAVLTIGMLVLGVQSIRRTLSLHGSVSAVFLIMAPVCAMTAAFFTTTQRWPALLGLAVGTLTAGSGEFETESGTEVQTQREIVAVKPQAQ